MAVVLFHADIAWAKGGYLGVDLFFVISGFLITGLLVGEIENTGGLALDRFYFRRARRLLPAYFLMTVAVIIAASLLAHDALPRLRWDALASLFYATNWELIYAGKSYFEVMGRQPLLLHLWSLAIEEQFYIVWAPIVFLCVPKFGRRTLIAIAFVLAIASLSWMAIEAARMGYPEQGDPSRLYFGTDTHGFALLIGALLALVWRPEQLPRALNVAANEGIFILGAVALTVTMLLFGFLDEAEAWLYPLGFLVSALASSALIVAATHPGGYFGRWIDQPLMRWLGERSYGIYLWHWPIFMLTRPDLDLNLPVPTIFVLRIALTLTIAALSYRYVEMPIRQGAIGRFWSRLGTDEFRLKAWRGSTVTLASSGLVSIAATILVLAPTETAPAQDVVEALGLNNKTESRAVNPKVVALVTMATQAVAMRPGSDLYTGSDVTGVGDSVLLGSSRVFMRMFPGAKVYATVGWQAENVLEQIQTLQTAHALSEVVLIHLGTNGYVTEGQLRKMLSLLADRKRVVLVNTHVPRRWMDPNNEMIDRVVPDFPNVVLVNWKDVSADHREYFVSDGVHLTVPGQRAFVGEIARVGQIAIAPPPDTKPPALRLAAASDGIPEEDKSPTLVRFAHPMASDFYWYKMAKCETGANWQNGGRYSGGLGIWAGSWKAWGGAEFASDASAATPEQQIIVANRISTQGWTRPNGSQQAPVGFSGWGCVHRIGPPVLLQFTPASVLDQQFHWQQHGEVVRELQVMMGQRGDGNYGWRTSVAHRELLRARGLSPDLAASPP